jgi:hypothetical protein
MSTPEDITRCVERDPHIHAFRSSSDSVPLYVTLQKRDLITNTLDTVSTPSAVFCEVRAVHFPFDADPHFGPESVDVFLKVHPRFGRVLGEKETGGVDANRQGLPLLASPMPQSRYLRHEQVC